MRLFRLSAIVLCGSLALPLAADEAAPQDGTETYDLIFKTGTLADLSEDTVLEYDRTVSAPANPDLSERNTGRLTVTFEPDEMARLTFYKGEQHRKLAAFPATVGNPVIMYFVETVVRDMAENAGGSPFYIRNRVKEALITSVPILDASEPFGAGDVAVKEITLRPFEGDPNRDRMQGYDALALTFTMSDEVPGWYYSLVAEVPEAGGEPIYLNALMLQPTEAAP